MMVDICAVHKGQLAFYCQVDFINVKLTERLCPPNFSNPEFYFDSGPTLTPNVISL